MKAHVNNSYIRKIHKQSNINCEKYVRKFWDLESMILLEKTLLDYNLSLRELLMVMVFKSYLNHWFLVDNVYHVPEL